jgi:hypothetical protein
LALIVVGGFAGVGHRWVGFAGVGLAGVGLARIGLARISSSSLGGIHRHRWGDWSPLGCISQCRSSLGWIPPLWSSGCRGFPCFAASCPPSSLPHFPLLTHLLSPSRPHPFGKGRGGCACALASEGAEAVLIEPTSLNRGEGLVTGFAGEFGGVEGEGEGKVMVESGGGGTRERTKINRDVVDGCLKLCSPP